MAISLEEPAGGTVGEPLTFETALVHLTSRIRAVTASTVLLIILIATSMEIARAAIVIRRRRNAAAKVHVSIICIRTFVLLGQGSPGVGRRGTAGKGGLAVGR